MGWICGPPIYEYKGWLFENHYWCGPWPMKKNLEPRARAGKVFYDVYYEWSLLDEDARESYRVGGGCQQF